MGSTSPKALSAPVTAMPCLSGTPASEDSNANSSAQEAESPSIPLYSCSNTTDADNARGATWANKADR